MNDNHRSFHDESDEALDRAIRAATEQPALSDVKNRVVETAAAWHGTTPVAVDDQRRMAYGVAVEGNEEGPSSVQALTRSAVLVEAAAPGPQPHQPRTRRGASRNHFLHRVRTVVVAHKRLSLAAASVVTALAGGLILYVTFLSSASSAYALEQTVRANDHVTSYHLKVIPPTPVAGLPGVGEGWVQLAPDGSPLDARVDIFGGQYGDRVGIVSKDRAEFWWKARNIRVVSYRQSFIDIILDQIGQLRSLFDPKLVFEQLRSDEAAGRVQVETRQPDNRGDPITLTVTSKGDPNRRHVYEINPYSKLVERVIEYQRRGSEWKQQWACSYFDYNKEIDFMVFQPEIPKNVTTLDASKIDFGNLGSGQGNLTPDQIAAKLARECMEAFSSGQYQAFARLSDVRTATWRITSEARGALGETETSTGTGMYLTPSHERTEKTMGGRKEIEICDGQRDDVLTIVPAAKTALVTSFTHQPSPRLFGRTFPNWRTTIANARHGTGGKAEWLGFETVDGYRAEGFRIRRGRSELTIWADMKTALPVRVERIAWVSPDEIRTVMTDFHTNVDLDKSLFNLDVPPGYAVRTMEVDLSRRPIDYLADTLKSAAEENGDIFPSSLVGEGGLSDILYRDIETLQKKYGKDSADMLKLESEITRNRQVVSIFLSNLTPANDWHYAGQSVLLYTSGKPIFWYKPKGDQLYRVIFADLKVKGLALEAFQFPFGPPSKPLGNDQFEVAFSYRPTKKAKSVYLAGAFNDWQPTALKMDGPDSKGRFNTQLKLKKGTYEYKFVVDGKTWETDPDNIWQSWRNGNSEAQVGLSASPRGKALEDSQFKVLFSYRPTEKAQSVYLAGSFNDWKPTALKMDGPDPQGRFSTRLKLKNGLYEYKFIVDGQNWKTDPDNVWRTGPYQNSLLYIGVR